MISLLAKSFQVNLEALKDWQDTEFGDRSDGFVTTSTGLDVYIVDQTPTDVTTVQNKWNSLVSEDQINAISKAEQLDVSINAAKAVILGLDWDDMDAIQKKIVVGVPLSSDEEDTVVSTYPG